MSPNKPCFDMRSSPWFNAPYKTMVWHSTLHKQPLKGRLIDILSSILLNVDTFVNPLCVNKGFEYNQSLSRSVLTRMLIELEPKW